jgi:hypothetical protein
VKLARAVQTFLNFADTCTEFTDNWANKTQQSALIQTIAQTVVVEVDDSEVGGKRKDKK